MVPSAATTLFEATIPSSSLRPLSRILVALSKLNDEVSFEATSSKVSNMKEAPSNVQVILSAINLSKSAFGISKLDGNAFFTSYHCPDPNGHGGVVVRCKMQTRVRMPQPVGLIITAPSEYLQST